MSPVTVLGWMVVGWFVVLTVALLGTIAHSVVQAWRTRPTARLTRMNEVLMRHNKEIEEERAYFLELLEREMRKSIQ